MFGKPLFTRATAASSPAPQFQLGPHTQTASKKPSSVFKKLLHVKNVFPRFSSAKKDVNSQGTSQRQHRVITPQPSHEGLAALAEDGVGFERPYQAHLRSLVEPTRSPGSLNLPPRLRTGSQSSTSSTARRSSFSANVSPLLAPPQSVATAPAATFARPRSSSHSSPQSAVLRSSTSPNPSLLAPPQSVATTPATTFAPARPSFQRSTPLTIPRSKFTPKVSSPLAAPPSVPTTSATTFAPPRSPSHRSTPSIAPPSTCSPNASPLLAPPHSAATTPATQPSPTFSTFQCSKPSSNLSPANQLIAELQDTIAFLDRQHNDCVRNVQSMIQGFIFPHTTSIVNETASAKKELEEVNKKIASADKECSKLEALWHEECDNLAGAEEALKKAKWHLEGVDEEQAALQAEVHQLQAGRPVNGVWEERANEASERDSASSQPAAENAKEEGGGSSTAPESFQLEKKAVKSWNPQWESQIALGRHSGPRSIKAVQVVTKSPEEDSRSESDGGNAQSANLAAPKPGQWMNQARGGLRPRASPAGTVQQPVTVSNESGGQTTDPRLRAAVQAYYNGTPLPRGQLAPDGPASAPKCNARSSKGA
ncbi:hypothetical protein M407DRAFT_22016 [Tulasnella calospora MUT 4182]|uniref:Uncharacterized protein n=1 Tax=Tulasnella calospora MUT 4182 TaxID=1051891 RepID=A0A0C3QNN5_9AGAM|nr:hypothetical protein M407DRAFT_22016 [Tulasnella calospora MUT 4182]